MKYLFVFLGLLLPALVIAQTDSLGHIHESSSESQTKEYEYLIKASDFIKAADYKAAAVYIKKAFAVNPKSADAYNTRGMLKSDQHQYADAIIDFTDAIKLQDHKQKENLAKAYNNRGYANSQLKDDVSAMADYTKALKLAPKNASANLNMGNVKAAARHYLEAIMYYTRSIAVDPKSGNAYNNRGLAKHFSGDRAGSCADLQKAVQLGFAPAKQNLINYCK